MSAVSVIMSTYSRNKPYGDCPCLLRRAINSILNQTFRDFELILIDDGSKDGTKAVCEEYAAKDSRIRLVRHEDNSNRPARRYNEGMLLAKTDYFMFMFDDDMWMPNAIQDLHAAITWQHQNCGMIYGRTIFHVLGKTVFLGDEWNAERQKDVNLLGNLAVIVKREVINTVGGYDESELFKRACDWDLWCRVGMAFKVVRIPTFVAEVTTMPDGLQSTVVLDYKGMKAAQRMKREFPLVGKL